MGQIIHKHRITYRS